MQILSLKAGTVLIFQAGYMQLYCSVRCCRSLTGSHPFEVCCFQSRFLCRQAFPYFCCQMMKAWEFLNFTDDQMHAVICSRRIQKKASHGRPSGLPWDAFFNFWRRNFLISIVRWMHKLKLINCGHFCSELGSEPEFTNEQELNTGSVVQWDA